MKSFKPMKELATNDCLQYENDNAQIVWLAKRESQGHK